MYKKAWMMITTYAWSCISLQFLKMAAHDHAIVIVTLTCSHSILLHSDTGMPSLHNASHCLLQSNTAVHTHNTLHPEAMNQPNFMLQHRVAVSSHAASQLRLAYRHTKTGCNVSAGPQMQPWWSVGTRMGSFGSGSPRLGRR